MLCSEDPEGWSTSEGEEDQLAPEGYRDGILTGFWRLCNDPKKRHFVDCSNCRKVYVDINAHAMKHIDDQNECFQVILMMKFWWLDPELKLTGSVTLSDGSKEVGTFLELAGNGDLKLKCKPSGEVKTFKKGQYRDKTIVEKDDMEDRFFPQYTFTNMQGDATVILPPRYNFVWSDHRGTFVSWEQKIDATFSESLELHYFPLDRQLCRIKILAEKTIEECQFVLLKKDNTGNLKQHCDTFIVDKEMQSLCPSYIRYNDYELPFYNQRSMVNVIFHLDRKGDYYFNNILMMVFLVNVMALCAFVIPLEDASGRLGLVSSCFLAVLAYRYIINEILPRKAYLTAADKYITFACVFLILICVQTVICTCWRSRIEKMDRDIDEELLSAKMAKLRRRQRLEYQDLLEYYDMMAGVFLSLAWVAWNIYLWCLWKWSKREPWHRVYANNEEPYAPVEECTACGLRWLAKQATHTDPKCTQCCPDKDCGAQKDQVRKIYLTPKQLPEPFVPPQPLPDGPKIG